MERLEEGDESMRPICMATLCAMLLACRPCYATPWAEHGALGVSDDGHALVHADGTPLRWVGDTAWVLHQNTSREDALEYLDDTVGRGFTVIQLMTVNGWALTGMRNYYGDTPYLEGTPWELNPPYWEHLAWVIDQAAERGLYVLLVYGSPGRQDEGVPYVRSPGEAYRYGRAVGSFLGALPNLIWCSGIDVAPDAVEHISPMGSEGWAAMAEGVADGVRGAGEFDGSADYSRILTTYHPSGGAITTSWFHEAPWLSFHGAQLGLRGDEICTMLAAAWALGDPKPVVNLEPWYEGCTWKTPPVDDWESRIQAYQGYFAGACGHTYGNYLVYPFNSTGEIEASLEKRWREGLKAPGRLQMRHFRALLETQPTVERAPSLPIVIQSDSGGHESGLPAERIAATGSLAAGWAWIYSPQGAGFVIDLASFERRPVRATWFDPRTGMTQVAQAPDADHHAYDPPGVAGRSNDWVLVLD